MVEQRPATPTANAWGESIATLFGDHCKCCGRCPAGTTMGNNCRRPTSTGRAATGQGGRGRALRHPGHCLGCLGCSALWRNGAGRSPFAHCARRSEVGPPLGRPRLSTCGRGGALFFRSPLRGRAWGIAMRILQVLCSSPLCGSLFVQPNASGAPAWGTLGAGLLGRFGFDQRGDLPTIESLATVQCVASLRSLNCDTWPVGG